MLMSVNNEIYNKGALLLGFDYYWCEDQEHILGIIRDIRQAYYFIKKSHPDKILILTDINPKDNEIKGIKSSDDLWFFGKIKNITKLVKTKEHFIRKFTDFVKNLTHLIIYYTGHSENNSIVIPSFKYQEITTNIINYHPITLKDDIINYSPITLKDDIINYSSIILKDDILYDIDESTKSKKIISELLPVDTIKLLITTNTNKKAQILIIMDCCFGNGFDLPFVMNRVNGIYELKSFKYKIPHQEILCISSSLQHQNSLSVHTGSLFSDLLFKKIQHMLFTKGHIKYINLIKEVGFQILNNYQQTINIHSSRPNIKLMWHWILGKSTKHIHNIHKKDNTIVINTKLPNNLKIQ